jgi:hypothetical protein
VVADVPLDEYGPDRLEQRLRDLDWVARAALAHEEVVEHFARARGSAVVPMKLFTMFSSEERAVREMARRRAEIGAALRRVAGCEEWAVRVVRGAPKRDPQPLSAARSGTDFLRARKRVRDSARDEAVDATRAADAAFAQLSPIARDARRRNDAPAGAVPPLLDAAFLVPSSRRSKFRTAARRAARTCAEAGAEMTLTGPWPAYNFVQPSTERA